MSVSVVPGWGWGWGGETWLCVAAGRPDGRLLDSQLREALGVRGQLGPGVEMRSWFWVQSQALLPQTSVPGLLVAVPFWGGVSTPQPSPSL